MAKRDLGLVRAVAPGSPDGPELRRAEGEKEALEHERQLQQIRDSVQDRKERKKYANRLFVLIAVWLAVIGVVVVMDGLVAAPFKLSATVLATLIGSTTVSVLGLFAIVAKYLFPTR